MVGMPRDIDAERLMVKPEDHGGVYQKTLKQMIIEDTYYFRDDGRQYKNTVRKVQRENDKIYMRESGTWAQITKMTPINFQPAKILIRSGWNDIIE